MNEYIFVYGTLMSSFINSYSVLLRSNSNLVGNGFTYGSLYDAGKYPVAIYNSLDKRNKIFGEIYLLKNLNVIKKLDYYEGFGTSFQEPNEYIRIKIPVFSAQKKNLCWFYNYNYQTNGLYKIVSGNYANYKNTIG